jgi:hypothetical protein
MPGQFVEGAWKEQPVIEKLAQDMLQAAALHHDEYNQTHNTRCAVTWLSSSQGALVVFAADPKYAGKIRRFCEGLK